MLYPTAMGAAFNDLPEALQRFHSVEGSDFYKGHVIVTHGGTLARRVAQAGGMPGQSGEMPFSFRMTRDGAAEIWERNFGGHITRSRQWLAAPGVVGEKVGTSVFEMVPKVLNGGLHIPITRITGFGLPVPHRLVESCEGMERVGAAGAITFDVHAKVKRLGLIIRYQGELVRHPER